VAFAHEKLAEPEPNQLARIIRRSLRDTGLAMSEESTTPDLVELVRHAYDASRHGDYDAMMSVYGRDAIWDMTPLGLGVYQGYAAIRSFIEDWIASFTDFEVEPAEIIDLGGGVTFAVVVQGGCPTGSNRRVQWRYAQVSAWVDGVAVRSTNYLDVDGARAAAERLAAERG
jgi:ketosteroid isomerase-like protein